MSRRGFALVTVFVMTAILVMMAGALAVRSRTGSMLMATSRKEAQALYAAEAGLADALSRLAADKTLNTGWSQPVTPGLADPYYTIDFDATHSVNNLQTDAAVDGPRGAGSVAPRTAYLVVEGHCGEIVRRLEASVARSGPMAANEALLVGGDVTMNGQVRVRGEQSIEAPGRIDADIVATGATSAMTLGFSAPAVVNGSIRNNGPSVSAGPMAQVSGAVRTNQNASAPPDLDISGRVAAKSSAPVPTLAPGTTVLAPGDYYLPAGANYNGDIVLNGANLYVQGDLTLNGALKGQGSVFVTGKTSLYGDSRLVSGNPQMMALMSKGDVTLQGVDGDAYMASILPTLGSGPSGDSYVALWARAQDYVDKMHDAVVAGDAVPADPALGLPAGTMKFGNGAVGMSGTSEADHYGDLLTTKNPVVNPLLAVSQAIAGAPASSANDFMRKKLEYLTHPTDTTQGFFHHHSGGVPSAIATLNVFNTTGAPDGVADALNDLWGTGAFPAPVRKRWRAMLLHSVRKLSNRGLGSAYFSGLVYTNGNLVAQNDIRIVGALVVGGNLTLSNKIAVDYVPDAAALAGSSIGSMGVRTWLLP